MRSRTLFSTAIAALLSSVVAKDGRTFAVLRFYGDGPLMEGRVDPIVQPGGPSAHVHTVMGASNFGFSSTADDLLQSTCTNAMIKGDMSNYWFPKLYFHDKAANTFEPVEMFYMNVYYFFEGTNDQIKAFPHGLQMVSGNAMLRTAPSTGGKTKLSSPNPQPASWTCPRSNFNPPSWPAGSDGSVAGMGDPNNKGEGVGFPFAECDGYASPLRADLHFPSCYNPAAGLTSFKTNMAFPSDAGNGKQDCPQGWIHVPHIFFEVYWNTPKFKDRWTPNQGSQPFVLSNGDRTGFSMHGDFLAAWDEKVLQNIIDKCDAGSSGMDKCPGVTLNNKDTKCKIQSPVNEVITGKLSKLPGANELAGWGIGNTNPAPPPASGGDSGSGSGGGSSSSAPPPPPASSTQKPSPSTEPKPSQKSADPPAPPPVVTPPPAQEQQPTSVVSKVVATTDADGRPTMVTVWETVTAWVTKTVYEDEYTPAPTGSPSVKQQAAGFTLAGCYKDSPSRAIQGEKFPKLGPLTNEKCVSHCTSKGFSVAGTENGGQCFCGNAVTPAEKLDDSACDTPCEGDSAQNCGGGWALTVYSKDGSLSKRTAVEDGHHHYLHGRHAHNHMMHHRNKHYSPRRR